ncbi:MFS general substrate transporter [Schizophyllum amplum]|uniref:MFS general substrate transporter n=1 Tax=Schizophyllum amplum TaxID=97359 RepID=A0A550CGG8_9AGAR|nr:MFS general substrate transporter [Auriculariopsis ampla]
MSPTLSTWTSNTSQLPPVDRGFGAWSFLAAACLVESITWGFPEAYGSFLSVYLDDPRFSSQETLLALVGPVASGIMYCATPLIEPVVRRYPPYRRPLLWIGTMLCFASMFGASYAQTATQLLALQGVLYAFGGSVVYVVTISYMSQWFLDRRGLANGVMFAGSSAGGIILPLTSPRLIARYGIATTMKIYAVALLVLLVPVLPFVKERFPDTHNHVHGPAPRSRKDWYKERSFQYLLAANSLHAFGYFVPLVWLPTFAGELNLSASKSSLTLTIFNCASACGRLVIGALSDRFDPWALAFGNLLSGCFSAFVLWGVLSRNFAGLMAFSVVYGAFCGGWATLWTGFIRPIAKDDPNLATTLFGWLLLNAWTRKHISTPISTALETHVATNVTATSVAALDIGIPSRGWAIRNMILYTGSCLAGAAVVAMFGWGSEVRKRVQEA